MKNIMILIAFFLICCQERNSTTAQRLSKIEFAQIEKVEIRKRDDSILVALSKEQIKKTVEIINSAKSAQLMKTVPKYWLIIQFKNKAVMKYKITDSKIGENDLYAELKEKYFFKAIYEKNSKKRNPID